MTFLTFCYKHIFAIKLLCKNVTLLPFTFCTIPKRPKFPISRRDFLIFKPKLFYLILLLDYHFGNFHGFFPGLFVPSITIKLPTLDIQWSLYLDSGYSNSQWLYPSVNIMEVWKMLFINTAYECLPNLH